MHRNQRKCCLLIFNFFDAFVNLSQIKFLSNYAQPLETWSSNALILNAVSIVAVLQ